ncbi:MULTISPECIES: hypothetical protein [unclassified Enterococcus]|uniref:hypothetical protein n=1 Tax=unclassified Enterococcus TaxID=2608891 RepID=UPI001CE14AD7|nr:MULTISPECIES: hypothetical protein [unclassified Enterococcus]MCA5013664.1 hypothetical protein [Enterococcus sp. S23]MCA5016914.1 hypothetical protein [Enterococcus sp. S22(2020)]
MKYVVFLLALIIVSACSAEKSTRDVELPKEDSPFTWWGDRTKNFGNSSYSISENEIIETVEDKYGLKVLPFFSEVRELIKEEYSIEGLEVTENIDIIAQENSFRLTAVSMFSNKDNENIVSARTIIEYEYYSKIGKVKLTNQNVDIRTAVSDEKYVGKNFEAFSKQLTELLKIDRSDKSVQKFEQKNKESKKELSGQEITIYNSKLKGEKDRTFGKNISVQYDGNGIPQNIFIGTKDYRY